MTNQAIIEDIIIRVIRAADRPMLPQPYRSWLASLSEHELDDYHQCVKTAHPTTIGFSSHA